MMKIGAIILCRYNSSRFHGKILKNIKNKTVLEIIHERISQVDKINDIIVSTSLESSDDIIADYCNEKQYKLFRGSLSDVSSRFLKTAKFYNLDYAIRINGDNVLVDIPTLENMVNITLQNKYNFISNVKNRSFPKGMSIEIVKVDYYSKLINFIIDNSEYREHVTLYYYKNKIKESHFVYNNEFPEMKGLQLALDTIEDFKFITKIFHEFQKEHTHYNLKEISEIIKKYHE